MLKKRTVQISLILLLCGLFDAAVAVDYETMWWRGRKDEPEKWAVDTRWNNPDNWYIKDDRDRKPSATDTVSLNGGTWDANLPYPSPNSVDPIIDGNNVGDNKAECWNLWLPYWQEPNFTDCVLWVVDGVLEVGQHFILGVSNRCDDTPPYTDHGILFMSGGTITVGQKLSVGGAGGWYCETQENGEGGQGIINMTGGTITCGTLYVPEGNYIDPNGGGTVNLDGGTIYADTFVMHPNDPNGLSGRMYITDGRLIIDGNQISLINGYAGDPNNWIAAGEPNWVIQAIYYSNMNTNLEDMDTTRVIARNPELAWTPYPKDNAVRIEDNVILSWLAGTQASGVNGHDVYFGSDEDSVRDANVTVQLGVYRGRQSGTTYDTGPLALEKGVQYYWRIDEVNNSSIPSEVFKGRVWNFTVDDGKAYNPSPGDSSTIGTIEPNLSWSPGTDSNSHDVYLGTDQTAVMNADSSDTTGIFVGNLHVNNYDPGLLLLGTTYFWRVDEVNSTTIKGNVWSFTTVERITVEDFDSYANSAALQSVWDDYWTNGTRAEVYLNKTYALDGNSLECQYDNGLSPYYSETEANVVDLAAGSDWTGIGAKAIGLYFYGRAGNAPTADDQLYIALEDTSANIGAVHYNGDVNDQKEEEWQEWNVSLSDPCFTGVNMASISKIYIGFGDRDNPQSGGDGIVYFDDIFLSASRCLAGYGPQVDLSGDCYVDTYDLRMLFDTWLSSGYDVNAAPNIPYDPCIWYKFDETSGPNAYDTMNPGSWFAATYQQDPCDTNNYDVDRIWDSTGGYDGNGCIVFGLKCNYAMRVPPTWFYMAEEAEQHAEQITICAWVKDVEPVPDVWQTLFHGKLQGPDYPYWMVGQWREDKDFMLSLFANKDAPRGSKDDWFVWEGIEDVTKWTHFAFVKDLYADEMIMYVDGMPVEMTTTDPNQNMDGDMMQVFYIGGPADRELIDQVEPPTQNKLRYDGSYLRGSAVDDFRIYTQALSHPEILKLAGLESIHVGIVPLLTPGDPYVDDKTDFKDFAVLANYWLEVPLWP